MTNQSLSGLPPFAPVPPPQIQEKASSADWETYLDAWTILTEFRLNLTPNNFDALAGEDSSAADFLSSYFSQLSSGTSTAKLRDGAKARKLKRVAYVLARRFLVEASPPPSSLLDWKFLANLLGSLPSSSATKDVSQQVWTKHEKVLANSLERERAALVKELSFSKFDSDDVAKRLHLLTTIAMNVPSAGSALAAGSDFLDSLDTLYIHNQNISLRKAVVANCYAGLTSLLKSQPPHLTALLDQLFEMKSSADRHAQKRAHQPTLLSDLVCSTNFMSHLQIAMAESEKKRGEQLFDSLIVYRAEMSSLHPLPKRKRKGKGKGAAAHDVGEMHIHKLSLVTQVQDLFPDLNEPYILKLLDAYSDSVETVTAHLLDNSLPPHLSDPNDISTPMSTQHTSVVPERSNVFDHDEIIQNASKLSYGKSTNKSQTADKLLADKSNHNASKAAILAALAVFDSDDDERDDTYDVADVGGTVDTALPGTDDAEANPVRRDQNRIEDAQPNDAVLYGIWKSTPELFTRDQNTRRSQARVQLRKDTGLTDEAIEGWAVMSSRDKNKASRLEARMMTEAGSRGAGGQREIERTSYRRPNLEGDDSEAGESGTGSGAERGGRGGGRARGGRGRGRGGRGRGGGDVAGPTGDKGTENARHRKDVNKASRANHNRREGRAKKMGRGMA